MDPNRECVLAISASEDTYFLTFQIRKSFLAIGVTTAAHPVARLRVYEAVRHGIADYVVTLLQNKA